LKLARRKHIIFCKFIRSQEELKEAFKSTGFELPKGIHEFEPAALSLHDFWDKNFDWDCENREHLETIEQET
jgi:hypothetical protein